VIAQEGSDPGLRTGGSRSGGIGRPRASHLANSPGVVAGDSVTPTPWRAGPCAGERSHMAGGGAWQQALGPGGGGVPPRPLPSTGAQRSRPSRLSPTTTARKRRRRWPRATAVACGFVLALAACGCSFRPRALERTHGRYNEAVRRVEEEILRNLVRLRSSQGAGGREGPRRRGVGARAGKPPGAAGSRAPIRGCRDPFPRHTSRPRSPVTSGDRRS
jgi:hypothetical protein